MNAKQLIAAAAIALTGAAAFAQDISPDFAPVSLKTREQVRLELDAARQDGTIKAWSNGYIEKTNGLKTRAQVQRELAQAIASGEFAAINHDTPTIARDARTLTARVR